MSISKTNIKEKIGATISLSKEQLLSGEYADEIRSLLEQRGVLVFPEINLNGEEQVKFTKTLGNFAAEHGVATDEVHAITLNKEETGAAEYLKGSMYWHIDGTMSKVPVLASMLTAKKLSNEGGQTEFCNTYAAYDDLSEKEKSEYDQLSVLHSAWATLFYYEPEPNLQKLQAMMAVGDNELPLVWEHKTGRKSLVLGATAYHVVDKNPKESAELLVKLRQWATKPEYVYRHEWKVGDMVMWDNTGTMHRATPYDPASGRMMHRTKLEGEEPIKMSASA